VTGKSFIVRKLIAFLLIFYTHHNDLGIHDRYFLTYTSFKKENIEGQLLKLLPEIRKAIECYNMLYPNMYIEWGETPTEMRVAKKLLNNTSIIHFNRVIHGESFAYSQMDIISLNNRVISAGITATTIIFEEAQDLSYDWASKQAIPFLGSTSGACISIGTANSDPESLLYKYYHTTNIPQENKLIYSWEEIYKYKKIISQEYADKYKKLVESEIAEKGIHSTIIQTEWYCNFSLTNDKFTSLEFLQENNILSGELEANISHYKDNPKQFRVGSFDGALKNDRASFCMGVIDIGFGGYNAQLKEAFVIKEAEENANPDDLIQEVVKLCISNKLDYLIVDNTSNMEYLTIYLYEAMKKAECKTQLVCFTFGGAREKVKMFSFFEALLFNQEIRFPKYEYIEHSKGLEYIITELSQLKRTKTSRGEYTYSGIDNANFYDDFAMATAMFAYSMKFIIDAIENKKEINIGRIQYRLYLKKWLEDIEVKKIPPMPRTYMTVF